MTLRARTGVAWNHLRRTKRGGVFFLAIVESRIAILRRIVPCRPRTSRTGCEIGRNVVQLCGHRKRGNALRAFFPFHVPKELHQASGARVPAATRACVASGDAGFRAGRASCSGWTRLSAALAQVHFVLQARECNRIRCRSRMIVSSIKNMARDFGYGEGLQVPVVLPRNVPGRRPRGAGLPNIVEFETLAVLFQNPRRSKEGSRCPRGECGFFSNRLARTARRVSCQGLGVSRSGVLHESQAATGSDFSAGLISLRARQIIKTAPEAQLAKRQCC